MERAWIYTIDLRKVHECHATMDPSEKEQRYLTYQLTFLLSYGWKMSGGFSEKNLRAVRICANLLAIAELSVAPKRLSVAFKRFSWETLA